MHDLLFLVHRLPYPPDKGDKIRSFNILQYLASKYRVHLGTFVDDPDDWRDVASLRQLCHQSCMVALNPRKANWRSLRGFMRGEALTLPYYRDPKLQAWVDQTITAHNVKRVLVYCSAMAQYVTRHLRDGVRSVIDFVDVDSDKWRQYSNRKAWPMSWLYWREYMHLLRYERAVAAKFDASVFVSKAEAALFKTFAPEVAERVTHMNNGIDTSYFSPDRKYPSPYTPDEKVLVFTGAMDYWANVDAVCWFAREVFPAIHACLPAARFYIVGRHPAKAVRNLAREPGIHITGRVPDVRPYLAHARAAVAPLRIARGVQNKILEAMAMGKPIIATTRALAGIESCPAFEHLIADKPSELADRAIEKLSSDENFVLAKLGRQCAFDYYNWGENLKRLEQLLEDNAPAVGV